MVEEGVILERWKGVFGTLDQDFLNFPLEAVAQAVSSSAMKCSREEGPTQMMIHESLALYYLMRIIG